MLIIKDAHFRFGHTKPLGRKETFEQEIIAKWEYIVNYAVSNGIQNIVFTGDILDIKAPSAYNLINISKLKKELNKAIDKGITLYSILGNHDLPLASRDLYPTSMFASLVEDGYLHRLGSDPIQIEDNYVFGVDYTSDQELFRAEVQYINDFDIGSTKKICVIHEHCIPDDEYEGHVNFFKYKDLVKAYPNINIWVCGHLHRGFPTQAVKYKTNQATFVNPWSLTRLARNYYALNNEHTPMFVHYHIDKFKDIIIPHSNFEEGFIEQELEKALSLELDLSSFTSTLEGFLKSGELDLNELNLNEQLKAKVEHYLNAAIKAK